MKILFVTREYPPSKRTGGIGSYVSDTSKMLVSLGHEVWVICANDDLNLQVSEASNGINILRLSGADYLPVIHGFFDKIASNLRKILRYISYRKKLINKIKEIVKLNSIEIIEFPEYGNEMLFWYKIKFDLKARVIIRLHGPTLLDRKTGGVISFIRAPMQYLFGYMEMVAVRNMNYITVPSNAMKEWAVKQGVERKIKTIPNAIDFYYWKSAVNKSAESSKAFRVFFAGTLVPDKGCPELISAVSKLRSQGVNIELIMAGKSSSYIKKVHSEIISKNINYIKIIGMIERSELATYYQYSDLVVFPSRWEPFGIVCLEAMACGALVLASSSGGMKEIIEHGVDGYLIEPGSQRKLEIEILKIISMSRDEKIKIRHAAALKIKEKYNSFFVVKKQVEYYEEICSQGGCA